MRNIQEVFDLIQQAKNEQKRINEMYRDSLLNNGEYQDLTEQIDALKEKKKQIEDAIKAELGTQYIKLEELKQNIKTNKEMLSDIAISNLMEGITVEVKDEYENLYEPKFSVNFKKTTAKAATEEQSNQSK